MGDPLDDLAAQQKADRLRASVTQAQGVAPSPDQWAQHQQAASALGVSPTLVATDPAFYHQAAATQSFDFSTYAKTYPLLSAWASTPDNAAVAHDDLNHLSGIEQVGHFAKSLLWDAPRALASEAYSKLIHGTAETAGKGMVNLGASSEPGGLVNRTLGTLGRSGQGIPALVALLAGKQLGAGSQTLQEMGTDVATSNRATQQAITGSYAPSWGGKAGGFAGDIAGTLGRYAIANAVLPGSSAAAMGLESGSNAYYDTGQQTDPATGQPYTDNQKRAMALIHGGVGFGLGFTHLVPGMGPSTGSALGVAAKELLVKAPITAAALTGSDLLSRAGVLGQDISADQVGQTFLQNYIQMAGFHGAGLIGQLSAIAQGSKLRKRSAEKFQEATKAALADSGIDTLNIPADRLDTYFQSKKMDSTTEVARILGNGDVKAGLLNAQRVLAEARAAGTDVSLPTSGFLAHLDVEHQKELLPDVRVQPNGPTAREYDAWVKEGGPDRLKAQTADVDAETQASPEYVALKTELLKRFGAVDNPGIAESNATLMANAYANLARESGMKPAELLAHYDPKVVLGMPPWAGEGETGGLEQGSLNSEPPRGVHFDDLPKEHQDRVVSGIEQDIQHWSDHPEAFHTAYEDDPETFGGRLVNGDIMRRLLPTVAKNVPLGLEAGNHTDAAIESLMMPLYRERVTRAIDMAGDKPVAITAGGQSSGKTKLARQILEHGRVGAVVDAPHDDFKSIKKVVDQVLQRGGDAVIYFVDRPTFFQAYKSMIRRAIREGRPVELSDMAAKHVAVPDEILKAGEAYRNQPRVHLVHILNPEGEGFDVVAGGPLSAEGKDAMTSIRNRASQTRDSLEAQGKAAYLDYLDGVQNGSEQPIPADLQRFFAGAGDVLLPSEPGIQGRLAEGDSGRPGQAGDLQPGLQAGYERLRSSLQALGISPEGDAADIRRQIAEKAQDPANVERVKAVMQALQDASGKTLFQGSDREFGSKAWQEYYGLTRGAGRAAGDMEIRAKEAGRKALTKKGYGEFDQQREDEIRAQEDLFAAFDKSLGEVAQPRGWFRILPDGTFEIGRTKIGDLSTFVHEPAHSYLLMIQDLVKREGASENLKADHAKILDFLGAKDGEELTRDQNEQWARANEAYLREGKAPSPGMRGVFQRFSVWLGSIYRKASDLGVELDPEIRGVFDRLYAAEEGVNKAHEELAGPQLFKSAEEAGWTPEQFQAYADSKGVEVDQAKQEILAKLNEAALREKSSEWRADERATREAVTTLVDERPEYRAIRALRRGTMDDGTELTLNREELVQQFGEDRVKELQKKHLGLYRKEGGVDPETAAEVLGFDSGEEMMQAFEGADRRAAVIEDATRQAMTEKHGDIRYDGTIEDQARIAVNNEQHAANLMRELDALQKQVEKAQQAKQATKAGIKAALTLPKLDQFRSEAKGLIEAKPIMDIQPNRYALAQQKYSREAFKGMGKGDYEGARDAKLKEITNHFLFLEALKAQAEVDKTFDFVKRFGKAKTRERIAKAGGEQGQHVYLDQIDQLLERFQFTNTSNKAIQAGQAQALEAWANQQAANGEPVEIDPSVYTMGSRNYRELNLGELRAVKDALANIDTLAKNADGILVDGRRVGMEVIRGLFDSITPDKERVPVLRAGDKTTLGEDAGHLVRGLDASLQKVEWMADRFDRGDINGPFRTYIKKLIDDANGRKLDLGYDIHTRIKALADARDPKDVARDMDQTGIKFPSQTREMTRQQLITWAMNMGTVENRNVALFGEGLVNGEGSVSPLVDAALSKLTASDCRFIQGIWDTMDVLRPLIRDKQLRTAGIEPKWKENTPFTVKTVDGETIYMKGGYFPLAGDPATTDVGKNQSDPLAVNGAGSRARPTVASGYTRDVTGATYNLWLEYPEVLSKHLNDVITNVTCGEAVAAVNKVISDPVISNAMAEKLGPEYVATLKPWLVDFVERAQDAPRPDALGNSITRFRSGMVVAKLAGNIPSIVGQVSDVFKPIFAPGVSNLELVKAYADMTLHGSDLVAEIKRLSPNEMRHRDETFNREIRDILTSKSLFDQKNHATAAFLMEGFRIMDSVVTFPTWLAVYRKGMNTHGIESQAVAEADRIVARTFQAGDPRNMSATFRNRNVWARLFTTFQNDGNTWYGIISSAVASKDVARVSAALMGAFVSQAAFQALKNRGPGDKKDLKAWTIQQALLTPVGSLPYLGDAVSSGLNLNGFSGGGDVTSSAMGQSVAAFAKPFTHYDTMDAQDMVLSELDAAAPWVGVAGTAPALRGWKYVHHVQTGKVKSPSNAWEATRDFLTGPNPNEGGR